MITATQLTSYDYISKISLRGTILIPVHANRLRTYYGVGKFSKQFDHIIIGKYNSKQWRSGNIMRFDIGGYITVLLICCYIVDKRSDIEIKAFEKGVYSYTMIMAEEDYPIVISKEMFDDDIKPCVNILSSYLDELVIAPVLWRC